jgi:hypothetical protein
MLCSPSSAGKTLPKEYRKAAEALFPGPDSTIQGSSLQAVLAFSDYLGVGTDFRRISEGWKDSGELEKFLHSFRNNLELLIQKTWVEKADELRKEKLLDRIPGFIALIKEGAYSKALEEFGAILEELAWLLFGSQSRQEDFFVYVFRIDHQLGLFWWYGGQLEQFLSIGAKETETLRGVLLLGLCYLTDF